MRPALNPGRPGRGFSITELMVGLTVGMLVAGGALAVHANQVASARRTLLQARLNQDLRAAMDLLTRDLRRAGHWGDALAGTRTGAADGLTPRNPYGAVALQPDAEVGYSFSRDAVENGQADDAERFGFRVQAGVLQMQTQAGQWRDLTDARSLRVPEGGFTLRERRIELPLGHLCATPCLASDASCPRSRLRLLTLRLSAQALQHPEVVRSAEGEVRLRNDEVQGQCPA